MVYFPGGTKKIKKEPEFVQAFEAYNKADTLLVLVHYSFKDQIDTAFKYLSKAGIKNTRLEITKDFFRLPR